MRNEIILYSPNGLSEHIEVRIEDDTVWLNRNQIAILFDRDIKTIGKHINNVFKEKELDKVSTVAKFAIVQNEGGRLVERHIEHYNLDVIISVGYRVKSKRGTQFRIWANKILKEYLLKGYSLNQRIDRIESNVEKLTDKLERIDLKINVNSLPNQGVFFDGQIFDAYKLISDIIKKAKKSIILIDNYIDETVLYLFTKRRKNIKTIFYTNTISKTLRLDLEKFNSQYEPIEIKKLKQSHDRFLILDEKTIYHFGASLKDLGKKWFAFSKLKIDPKIIIQKL